MELVTVWRVVVGAVLAVAVVAAWGTFAPVQLGGPAAYIVVRGDSMVPTYAAGDLVVVRRDAYPSVGEVAAYRHPELGIVIHRIVDREGERFRFQGDHNDFRDSYLPTASEIVGTAWLRVPELGRWLLPLRHPVVLGAFTAVAVLGLGGGASAPRRRRRANQRMRRAELFTLGGQG